MEKLDMLDKKILGVLSSDPRLPCSTIAKKVRSSKEVVNYRVKRMLDQGIIASFVTSLDLGYWSYKVFMQLEKIDNEQEKALIEYLENHDNTYWVTPCSGFYDLAFTIMAKDPSCFESTLRDIIKKAGKHLHDYRFAATIGTKTFAHEYILGKVDAEKSTMGKRKEQFILDEKDKNIAKLIRTNARIKLSEISSQAGIPIDTVNYRIQRMKERGVIRYCRTIIDPTKLGYQRYSILLRGANLSEKTLAKFEEYARQNPHIAFYGRCVGGWDIEFTLYLKNNNELRDLMLDMKKEFGEYIKRIQSVNLLSTKKYLFLPEELR